MAGAGTAGGASVTREEETFHDAVAHCAVLPLAAKLAVALPEGSIAAEPAAADWYCLTLDLPRRRLRTAQLACVFSEEVQAALSGGVQWWDMDGVP